MSYKGSGIKVTMPDGSKKIIFGVIDKTMEEVAGIIEQKKEELLNSIPKDYTALVAQVDTLQQTIDGLVNGNEVSY